MFICPAAERFAFQDAVVNRIHEAGRQEEARAKLVWVDGSIGTWSECKSRGDMCEAAASETFASILMRILVSSIDSISRPGFFPTDFG
jgi:hypothetical protein